MADNPRGEEAALVAVQSALADRPGVLAGARALSHFGEHSIGWVAVSALGALLQPRRRKAWLVAGAGAFIAHATAVAIKLPPRAFIRSIPPRLMRAALPLKEPSMAQQSLVEERHQM